MDVVTLYTRTWLCLGFEIYVNIYEGVVCDTYGRTVTNDGDDGNPVPQFLVSKTYLGGKKN